MMAEDYLYNFDLNTVACFIYCFNVLGWSVLFCLMIEIKSGLTGGFSNIVSILCYSDRSTNDMGTTDLLKPGDVVEHWSVVQKIGSGGFGQVYEVSSGSSVMALKLEAAKQTRKMLKIETDILKKLQGKENFCKYFAYGQNDQFNYVVMQLQGKNLNQLRLDNRPRAVFSLNTTIRCGLQMLKAIERFHELGFLHRDIKPSNFCIGAFPYNCKQVYLLDFGLARKYPSVKNEFKGTLRYASINAQNRKELGRQDDLWSLFYSLAEFISGKLPWQKVKDKDHIYLLKKQFHRSCLKQLPSPLLQFLEYLTELICTDKPDYQMLEDLFEKYLKDKGINGVDPFDWEESAAGTVDDSVASNLNNTTSSVKTLLSVKPFKRIFGVRKQFRRSPLYARKLKTLKIENVTEEKNLSSLSDTTKEEFPTNVISQCDKELSLTRCTVTDDIKNVRNFLRKEKLLSTNSNNCD